MNVLIAGGSGFLGYSIINKLLPSGANITVLSRGKKSLKQKAINVVHWNGEIVPEINDVFDVIINLSGASIGGKRWTDD